MRTRETAREDERCTGRVRRVDPAAGGKKRLREQRRMKRSQTFFDLVVHGERVIGLHVGRNQDLSGVLQHLKNSRGRVSQDFFFRATQTLLADSILLPRGLQVERRRLGTPVPLFTHALQNIRRTRGHVPWRRLQDILRGATKTLSGKVGK